MSIVKWLHRRGTYARASCRYAIDVTALFDITATTFQVV